MKNIILLGAPGTGKGTQAQNISDWYGVPQISTGEIFRANIRAGTELGLNAKEYIESGRLAPDGLTVGLVTERLAEEDCAGGFILDGFPRSVPQAEALDKWLAGNGRSIQVVASIYVADETIVSRLSGRRLCKNCGKPYHTVYNPPAKEGVCDACGGAVGQRDDDREGTVRERLSVYYAQTAPLIERYRKLGLFAQITGHELVEDTSAEMAAALKKVFGE